ncbi:MAG: molybdenum cofactor biosynthesis protein MoaE [Candidatus Bathyarchaeia archaeon]
MVTTHTGVHEKGTITLSDIIQNVKNKPDFQKAGAVALFIGVVRGETLKGEKVQKLELEAYEEKANEVLSKICEDLKKKKGIVDVQIHHLIGEFNVGEDLVYVMVAGAHRRNIFPTLQEAVERYKKEVPIFKKEHVIDKKGKKSAHWVTEQ